MGALTTLQLLLLGILAGEELAVRWGVHPAVAGLPDEVHLAVRIALVKRLRVAVPVVMIPAALTTVAVLVAGRGAGPVACRAAGAAALLVYLLVSFLGTVPLNIRVNNWAAAAPPPGWRALVRRWTALDTIRSSAALLAFLLFTLAAVA